MHAMLHTPFLRIPPFPGARSINWTREWSVDDDQLSDEAIVDLISVIRRARVGGDYWAAQPGLGTRPYTVVSVRDKAARDDVIGSVRDQPLVIIGGDGINSVHLSGSAMVVREVCDPWHLVATAAQVVADSAELALVSAIAGVPLTFVGEGQFAGLGSAGARSSIIDIVREQVVEAFGYVDPFTGDPIATREAVRLCAFWRELIDSNREIGSAAGFAFWKRESVAPLLWNGSAGVRFVSRSSDIDPSRSVAIWTARTSPALYDQLDRSGVRLVEVEDGFIRSAGLGADCIPPLSIVVDKRGAHVDPSKPCDLENILQQGCFGTEILSRAARLREAIVSSGIGKYGAASASLERRVAGRSHVLVPGQVADDRAVRLGSGNVNGNLDLLRRVRELEPNAYIIFKPHPDVEAGHRAGNIPDDECLRFVDEIVREAPISALIDIVDEVHVISSLAGFEALMRGKKVTAHGVPFYAGWGLTRDLGPVPARRTAPRTLDELIAAVLLIYPRYLDPLTGLPCPPEVLVQRLSQGGLRQPKGLVVQFRRLQGRLSKRLAKASRDGSR
jgi:capsular polysaccharide export protein